MTVTTNTKKLFSGYFGTVVVDVEDQTSFFVSDDTRTIDHQPDAVIRLRDTAQAMLAAADYLDTLK